MQQLPGHDKKGRKMEDNQYGGMGPALSIHSNAEDLVKFVSANLDFKDSVISSALKNTQQRKVAILYNKKLRDSYGAMGWMLSPLKSNSSSRVVWQSSALNGYAC